jgi:hypothetical protein
MRDLDGAMRRISSISSIRRLPDDPGKGNLKDADGAYSGAMPKMKAYATFDLYLADQPPKNRAIIRALRAFVKRAAPALVESVKWGNGCWLKGKAPVAYVYSDDGFVQFGFIRGAALEDPAGLLEGKAQYVRHIKVSKVSDIAPRMFAPLVRQAVNLTPGS